METLSRIWHDQSGQDMAEYTLLIVLIAIACIGAITLLGNGIQAGMQAAADGMAIGGP